ncbi:type II secretion system F family protein [Burkholderia territorii]|uniref:type II secretion system F family protein n=1 Tax=Burkholderia territorii TaxID=1503055 RepID=UPI0007581583|nr:type II secretion system F family protein [Burkholderia territorii]KWE37940.1 secretion system protein [Burkholderia territorii]KWE41447.1 secretion system protein [Burkholderia territorii]KWE41758.1 secretion system protein [Burkholderia territorii]
MTHFYYFQVVQATGKSHSGVVGLAMQELPAVRAWLESKYQGVIVRLHALPAWVGYALERAQRFRQPKIKSRDLAGLLRDLAVMTAAGVPILESIASTADKDAQNTHPAVARVGRRLLEDLEAGATVSQAFARQPAVFPETVRSLVAIGDETGSMDKMLMEASDHVERVIGMKANAMQALIYPMFVFLSIFGAAGFWIYYVIPNLSGLFKQMNVPLPALTVAVLAIADWVTAHAIELGLGVLLLSSACVIAWRGSAAIRRTVYALLHRLPISRTLLTSSGLAFFSEYLAILVHAGIGIVESLQIMEQTVKDLFYRDRLVAMRQFVQRGDRVSAAMRQVGGFPAMMTRMISVGEETGTLDRQLSHLAMEYRTRFTRVIAMLSEIMQPLVIVLAGGLFIVMIMALLLPVYDLVRQTMSARYS